MFGKTYPNCVKNTNEEQEVEETWSKKYKDSINCSDPKGFSQKAHCAGKKKNESVAEGIPFNQCPSCGGKIVHESQMNEEKDACYHKVKSRYKVWPSAYASGALVKCRKAGAKNWGNKSESVAEGTDRSDIRPARVGDEIVLKNSKYRGVIVKLGADGEFSFKNDSDGIRYRGNTVMIDRNLSQENRYKERSDVDNKRFDDAMSSDMERIDKSGALKKFGIGEETEHLDEKGPGLWANIHAKQNRIKSGSGERMRKPGSKGAPSNKDLTSIRAASKNESLENNTDHNQKSVEEATMSRAAKGNEKYGKDGMRALAKAGREGSSEKTLDTIRDRYNKYEKKSVKETSNYGDLDEAFNLEEEINKLDEKSAAWQRKAGKSKSGGLNKKGVASYRRANPGSKLQTAVTTKPSKLKPGSKPAKRRKSFCARMSGVKGPMKDEKGKPTRKALALRKWNC